MKNKEIRKLFLTLILFSLSGGIYYNFQEVWLADNGMSVRTISMVYSLCALLTVSSIFLCSNIIKQNKIKKFACAFLLIKTLSIFSLFLLNNTGFNVIIKFLIMLDYALDVETYACIYPMITLITKSDKIYAARGLTYSFVYYLGVGASALLLGRIIGSIQINNNLYVLTGAILTCLAFIVLLTTDINKYYQKSEPSEKNLLFKLLSSIKKDKISIMYLISVLFGQVAYYCILGMQITLLVNLYGITSNIAAMIYLVLGISASFFGFIVLWKLTFKNNYLNISIKLLGRAIIFLLAFIFNQNFLYVLALIYPAFTAESHTHIIDAPYINRHEEKYQLAFYNLRDMTSYTGRSIGTLLCGVGITYGIRYIFGFSFIFVAMQVTLCYICLYLRTKEKGVANDRK